jgi:hypothetical protein
MDLQLDSVVIDSGDGTVVARLLLAGRHVWTTPPARDDEAALSLLSSHVAASLGRLLAEPASADGAAHKGPYRS